MLVYWFACVAIVLPLQLRHRLRITRVQLLIFVILVVPEGTGRGIERGELVTQPAAQPQVDCVLGVALNAAAFKN